MFGWTGAQVEGGGGVEGLVCNGEKYHTYEMEPHPQGSIPQYTTVYHSIPQYITVQYTTVYHSIPQYTTVCYSISQYIIRSTQSQFQHSLVSEGGRKPLLKFQ